VNRDLLEALGALAADFYLDAMSRHPGLFACSGVEDATDDDRRIAPVLWQIDELIIVIDRVLRPPPVLPPHPDDDLPF
jgi:hypothetical protein